MTAIESYAFLALAKEWEHKAQDPCDGCSYSSDFKRARKLAYEDAARDLQRLVEMAKKSQPKT